MRRLAGLVFVLSLAAACASAPVIRSAAQITVGQTAHFLIQKGERLDYAISLPADSYYIVCDVKRTESRPWNMTATVQLLKSNGSVVNSNLLSVDELESVARVGSKFTITKPLDARLRICNEDDPLEVWMTIVPAKEMKFWPFAWSKKSGCRHAGLRLNDAKGGKLDQYGWGIHSATLPAGKYDVSLYFKRQDGRKDDTIIGDVEQWDCLGFKTCWKLNLIELGPEARSEKRLVLTKPATVIFRVQNLDAPVEYKVGIEKAD